MLPSALLQQMPAQILLVATLHHDHFGRGSGIVHTSGHDDIEPVHSALANRIRFGFLDVMGIVADNPVATLPGDSATD